MAAERLIHALRCSRLLLEPAAPRRGRLLARHRRSLLIEWSRAGGPVTPRSGAGPGPGCPGCSSGELDYLWLLDPGLDLSPRGCVCPLDEIDPDPREWLSWTGNSLELGGGLRLELAGAEIWEPLWQLPAPPPPPRAERLRPSPPREPLSPAVQHLLEGLAVAPPSTPALAALLGLGQGSTPEGDDLLIGLRGAWQLRRHLGEQVPLELLDELLAGTSLQQTHPVSLLGLRDAARGLYPEALARSLDALSGAGDLSATLAALERLGGSSGRALCWGLWRGWSWP